MINITLQLGFFPPTIQSVVDIFPSYYLDTPDKAARYLPKLHRILTKVNRSISFDFLATVFCISLTEVQSTRFQNLVWDGGSTSKNS